MEKDEIIAEFKKRYGRIIRRFALDGLSTKFVQTLNGREGQTPTYLRLGVSFANFKELINFSILIRNLLTFNFEKIIVNSIKLSRNRKCKGKIGTPLGVAEEVTSSA